MKKAESWWSWLKVAGSILKGMKEDESRGNWMKLKFFDKIELDDRILMKMAKSGSKSMKWMEVDEN